MDGERASGHQNTWPRSKVTQDTRNGVAAAKTAHETRPIAVCARLRINGGVRIRKQRNQIAIS